MPQNIENPDKLEIFRFSCTVLVWGGTLFAIVNPVIGISVATGAALAHIFTNP